MSQLSVTTASIRRKVRRAYARTWLLITYDVMEHMRMHVYD